MGLVLKKFEVKSFAYIFQGLKAAGLNPLGSVLKKNNTVVYLSRFKISTPKCIKEYMFLKTNYDNTIWFNIWLTYNYTYITNDFMRFI